MAKFHCFSGLLVGRKKKSKVSPKSVDVYKGTLNGILQVKQEESINPSDISAQDTSFDAVVLSGTQDKSSICNVKVVGDENLDRAKATAETAYEGGDERDEILSMRRNFSDFDLQAQSATNGEIGSHGSIGSTPELNSDESENKWCRDEVVVAAETVTQSGHVSDPCLGQATALWGSPRLKRSCSNIETETAIKLPMMPTKSDSYDDLQNLMGNARGDCFNGIQSSPSSVMTSCSADRVMLKKRSSSQILRSRSRKLWWKLFLWSHRNLHKNWRLEPQRPVAINESSNHKGGYSSDTIEPCLAFDMMSKKAFEEAKNKSRTDLWPQNHWVAFSAESSSLDRVDAWVNSIEMSSFCPVDKDDNGNGELTGAIIYPNSPKIGESSLKNHLHTGRSLAEEVVQASNIIKSLNFSAMVAHISGMGLKIIPAISAFSRLRSVNLSGNLIVHITPGSLPKSLHTLDLSRNKIATIEGLRELTRLRVLNLSYNRISRIGHGLSNCILIKELYLAGNKINEVEGLHRLLKLSVLDLSFNKITTAKALGQLVANYNSLLALNLLGNPIQSNIGDDQLRKAVSGLLPKLAYLNKQPIKPKRARGVANSDIAKAALGNSEWINSWRRLGRRPSQGSSSSNKGRIWEGTEHRGLGTIGEQKNNRQGLKIRHHRTPSLRK